MIRAAVLGLIFILILIGAHPLNPIEKFSHTLFGCLDYLGINVAMQPITYDMTGLYDSDEKINIYELDMTIRYQVPGGETLIPVGNTPFYRFRVPALVFIEWYTLGDNPKVYLYALCHELRRVHGPGDAFMIHVDTDDSKVQKFGFNQYHACPES